jgi:hypothetical protein
MKTTIALSLLLFSACFGYAQTTSADTLQNATIKRFRAAATAGWGYQQGKIDEAVQGELLEYSEQLRNGAQYSGHVQYFFFKNFGIGLEFAGFRATNQTTLVVEDVSFPGLREEFDVRDDIAIDFFGASVNGRFQVFKNKIAIIPGIAFGQITYRNNAIFQVASELRGTAPGVIFDLNIDAALSKNFSFVVAASTQQGLLKFVDFTDAWGTTTRLDLNNGNERSLSRIGVSCGFSITF